MSTENVRPRVRADARRNRDKLVAAATEAFASGADPVSLDSIARTAGVGTGTLYRHFPTREDLVEAVYVEQMERLRTGAEQLLSERAPSSALRAWTELFADWAATKHGMIGSLGAIVAAGRLEHAQMRAELVAIVERFLGAGAAAGDLRDDIAAGDVAAVFAGVLMVAGDPAQRPQTLRMFDLVVDGLIPPRPA